MLEVLKISVKLIINKNNLIITYHFKISLKPINLLYMINLDLSVRICKRIQKVNQNIDKIKQIITNKILFTKIILNKTK